MRYEPLSHEQIEQIKKDIQGDVKAARSRLGFIRYVALSSAAFVTSSGVLFAQTMSTQEYVNMLTLTSVVAGVFLVKKITDAVILSKQIIQDAPARLQQYDRVSHAQTSLLREQIEQTPKASKIFHDILSSRRYLVTHEWQSLKECCDKHAQKARKHSV